MDGRQRFIIGHSCAVSKRSGLQNETNRASLEASEIRKQTTAPFVNRLIGIPSHQANPPLRAAAASSETSCVAGGTRVGREVVRFWGVGGSVCRPTHYMQYKSTCTGSIFGGYRQDLQTLDTLLRYPPKKHLKILCALPWPFQLPSFLVNRPNQ